MGFSPLVNDFDDLTNEYGSIRRSKVYSSYVNNLISEKDVQNLYVQWRDDPEYIVLRGTVESDTMQQFLLQNNSGIGDTWYSEPEIGYLYRFVKASKRGNDVYRHLVKEKLKPLHELNEITFFNDDDANKKTSLLFVTLTSDVKRCSSHDAWHNIEKEYHLFKSNLHKLYGDIETFRVWESTKNYYPHIHVMILFKEYSFPVFVHIKDDEKTYRIPYNVKEKISKYWHSHIDVQALKSTADAFRELTKYISKDLCSDKGDKTNAMIWLRRKRSYAVSKGFIMSIQGWYIDFNEPTNFDLILKMCNRNLDGVKWEFLGMLRGQDLGFFSDIWVVDLKKPPPRVVELVENEQIRWNRTHRSKSAFVEMMDLNKGVFDD